INHCKNSGRMHFTYKADTNLLTKKIVNNGWIGKRYFYFYDDDAALTKEVFDNSAEEEFDDLTNVQERHIREMKPRFASSSGQEEIIEEKFYDVKLNQEKLKRRIRHQFDIQGHILQREIYDSSGTLAKVEKYTYDAHGNCTSFINAIGEKSIFSYDLNDNCVQIEEYPNGRITTFQYDQNNRLLVRQENYKDGGIVKTTFAYD